MPIDKPSISIIMPLYNKKAYVQRAIKSLQMQTYTDWELIVVDDGSTDGSQYLIPNNDERIKIYNQENKGPAAARNKGIKLSKGELVSFLDADDYYFPDKIEREVNLLLSEKKADWLLSAFEVDTFGKIHSFKIRNEIGKEIDRKIKIIESGIRELTVTGIHIDGLCIKKELLNQLNGFDESMRCYEITDLILRCVLEFPKLVIIQKPLFCIVKTPNSAFTVISDKIDGQKKLGYKLMDLSKIYNIHKDYLRTLAKKTFINYSHWKLSQGEFSIVRKFLKNEFPFKHDFLWCKLLFYSYLPKSFYYILKKKHIRKLINQEY